MDPRSLMNTSTTEGLVVVTLVLLVLVFVDWVERR